tara:strand:- start:290 stop:685 length:396 start_codon:yes stop_codon:yes gene_type:complete
MEIENLSLTDKIKKLLTLNDEKRRHAEAGKEIRKEFIAVQQNVCSSMEEQGLRVVRVMQHASGPHDVVHNTKTRKRCFTQKTMEESATEFFGQELTSELLKKIFDKVREPDPNAVEVNSLSVKRIKTTQKD